MADGRRAFVVAAGALLAIYLATLAPTVTLWDSGEFLAAIHSLGIPHPPGTPLFVFGARAWSALLGAVPFAAAVNASSAVATSLAGGCIAWLVTRWTGREAAGVLGAVVAGTGTVIWQNATETEVYAWSLLLSCLMLVVAEHAGSDWSPRYRLLLAFVFGLAIPLHLSALVAGPAAVLLAATDAGGSWSLRSALAPGGAFLFAVGIGMVAVIPLVAGLVLLVAASSVPSADAVTTRWRRCAAGGLLVALGASFVVVMPVRARVDPAVNQGNPATWHALTDVVARRQYDVPGLWPRRAPLWLQVGNVVEYADWQFAGGLSDAPGPSPGRTAVTMVFALLGIAGARWHRARDRRSWRACLLLIVCASLGVVVVLNLRAGPSFGWGILPAGAEREARERDYFFALAFAVWGSWAGMGLVAVGDRLRAPVWRRAVSAIALAPTLLNWSAIDRRRLPDAGLAESLGRELTAAAPPDAVLILAGDNDSYAVWYAQQVLMLRNDVTPVTIPLLGAHWYREELARRHRLLDGDHVEQWYGRRATLAAIARGTRTARREIAVAASVEPEDRAALGMAGSGEGDESKGGEGGNWTLTGLLYRARDTVLGRRLQIDSVASELQASRVDALVIVPPRARGARDATGRYIQQLLGCPAAARANVRGSERPTGLLESTCNYR